MRSLCFVFVVALGGCADILGLDAYDDQKSPSASVSAIAATVGTGGGANAGGGGAAGTAGAGGTGGAFDGRCGEGLCVFASSMAVSPGTSGNFDTVAKANDLCAGWAMDAQLAGTVWRAWLSDGTVSAPENLEATGPWFDRADQLVAVDKFTLIGGGGLEHGISLDEYGLQAQGLAWTGTLDNGGSGAHCDTWNSDSSSMQGMVGKLGAFDGDWTAIRTASCSLPNHLYCFAID